MKKSFKFLFVFSAVAIILCCSVFVSAAGSSDTVKYTPSQFIDKFNKTMDFYDNDGVLYSYNWSKNKLADGSWYMSKYLESNPGLDSTMNTRYFYGMESFQPGITIAPGEYVSTTVHFYARVTSGVNIEYCTVSRSDGGGEDIYPVRTVKNYQNSGVDLFYFEYDTLVQNNTNNTFKNFEMDFTFAFTGRTQFSGYGLGFNDDIVMSVSSEKPKYSQPSDSAITQQDDLTSEIENQTSQGNHEATNIFNSFDGLIGSDSNLYRGLLAVSTIINEWLGIEWLSPIVFFSLILGIFSFILGSAIYFSYFHSRKEAYNLRAAAFEKRYSKSKGS